MGQWALRVALAVLLGATLFAGCGGEKVKGPPTVPLKGKIEFPKGGNARDLANNSVLVEFQSIDHPEIKAFGEILEDGTFSMTSQIDGKGKPGVISGAHRVRLNADDAAARFLAPKFFRHETSGITVKAPSEKE